MMKLSSHGSHGRGIVKRDVLQMKWQEISLKSGLIWKERHLLIANGGQYDAI